MQIKNQFLKILSVNLCLIRVCLVSIVEEIVELSIQLPSPFSLQIFDSTNAARTVWFFCSGAGVTRAMVYLTVH